MSHKHTKLCYAIKITHITYKILWDDIVFFLLSLAEVLSDVYMDKWFGQIGVD